MFKKQFKKIMGYSTSIEERLWGIEEYLVEESKFNPAAFDFNAKVFEEGARVEEELGRRRYEDYLKRLVDWKDITKEWPAVGDTIYFQRPLGYKNVRTAYGTVTGLVINHTGINTASLLEIRIEQRGVDGGWPKPYKDITHWTKEL